MSDYPLYDNFESIELSAHSYFTCRICGAVVTEWDREKHLAWHKATGR